MVTLKLALDAQGFRAGIPGVIGDLRSVQQEAKKTGEAIDIYGSGAVVRNWERGRESVLKYGKAIEAVTEVTQVGGRVRLLGEEIKNLGSGFGSAAGVAQTFAGALIDVAQVAQKADGSLKGFALALRANPILAAAGVISLIASAMALFGGETRDTTKELEKQVDVLESLRRAATDAQTQLKITQELERAGFALEPGRLAEDRGRAIAEQIARLPDGGRIPISDLSRLTNLSAEEIARRAPQGSVSFLPSFSSAQPNGDRVPFSLSNEGAREFLRQIAQELRRTAEIASLAPGQRTVADASLFPTVGVYGGIGADRPYGPQLPTPGVGYFNGPIGPMPGEESPFARVTRMNEIQDAERQLAEFNERLAQTRQLGLEVGTALGNSFFSFLQNANNARGVLVGLLQQLSQIAQQRIVSGFANGVANLFAPTPTQTATTNPNMTGYGPQVAPGFQN